MIPTRAKYNLTGCAIAITVIALIFGIMGVVELIALPIIVVFAVFASYWIGQHTFDKFDDGGYTADCVYCGRCVGTAPFVASHLAV